jgi:hypothetical protein
LAWCEKCQFIGFVCDKCKSSFCRCCKSGYGCRCCEKKWCTDCDEGAQECIHCGE